MQPKKMSKQTKITMIITLACLVLVTIFYFVRFFSGKIEATETETAEILVDVAVEDIIQFSYDYEGATYRFEKTEDVWYYAEDHSLNITQQQINNMLSGIAPLKSLMLIDDATDMTQFGLSIENRMLEFETADAKYAFELGGKNYMVEASYIRKPDDSIIYVVESSMVSAFDKALEELID